MGCQHLYFLFVLLASWQLLVAGLRDSCYVTFGGDDYLDIPNITLTNNFTIEFYFSISDSKKSTYTLVSYWDPILGKAGVLSLGTVKGSSQPRVVMGGQSASRSAYTSATWHHMAWVYSTNVGTKVYLNGNEVLSLTNRNQVINSGGRLLFGQEPLAYPNNHFVTDYRFVGSMDDIRVWNYARTQAQIKSDSTIAISSTAAGLIALYEFPTRCSTANIELSRATHNTSISGTKGPSIWTGCSNCAHDTYGEFADLYRFFLDTKGPDTWINKENWAQPTYQARPVNNPCSWPRPWDGVLCEGLRVTSLNLRSFGISGTIPDYTFRNFTQLRYLGLAENKFTGSIPSSIQYLTGCTHFILRDNAFTGSIPAAIGGLTKVKRMLLENNRLTGGIPAQFSQLTSLEEFDASNNTLDGSISGVGSISTLQYLYLNDNRLTGTLPANLINHPTLKFLYLGNNNLIGPIPEQTTSTKMQEMSLINNNFKCKLPNFMYGNVMYTLNIYNNTFWCPTTGTSAAVFGVHCSPLRIDSITPNSFLNTNPRPLEITIAVKGLQSCPGIQCFVNGANGTAGTIITPSSWNDTHVVCTLPATSARTANVAIYYNNSQVSSTIDFVNYYLNCPTSCNNGTCDTSTGTCRCSNQFTGPACNLMRCPNDCRGNGVCDYSTGTCGCTYPYSGADCSIIFKTCPGNCSAPNGTCDPTTGKCGCVAGYWGEDCSNIICPPYNNPPFCYNGVCNGKTGECICNEGYLEPFCMIPIRNCPNNCTNSTNGQCNRELGSCVCYTGFYGDDCSLKTCPGNGNCNGHGQCNSTTGKCACNTNYQSTDDCSVYKTNCTNDCVDLNHGYCDQRTGRCVCNPGFTGEDCSSRACAGVAPNYCSSPNGVCNFTTGVCACSTNYTGSYCQLGNRPCPNSCGSRGQCNPNTGECLCTPPAVGVDCSEITCYGNCNGNGICNTNNGTCTCNSGWTLAPDCSIRTVNCVHTCNEGIGGTCNTRTGACICKEGYTSVDAVGPQCTQRLCTGNCNAPLGGACNSSSGECVCSEHYFGRNCENANHTCAGDCGGVERGLCDKTVGICRCFTRNNATYFGSNCEYMACPGNCTNSEQGECNLSTGVCACKNGWYGSACDTTSCKVECVHGTCRNSTGLCECSNSTYSGADCSQFSCSIYNFCSGNGACNQVTGLCDCNANYTGPSCSILDIKCPNNCTGNGGCDKSTGKCSCVSEFTGADCAGIRCKPENCNDNGICDYTTGNCTCFSNFTGSLCLTPYYNCPNNCSNNGNCLTSSGVCTCNEGYTLLDCSGMACVQNCSGHGVCDYTSGKCACEGDWGGEGCDTTDDEKQDTKSIALGAALGGAGVIAASAGAFYLIRRHQISELKKKKAIKLNAMSSAAPAN